MAMTPDALPRNHAVDFRAPPPSPVASGRRSSFTNEDILTEYLQQSLKVPDLILPDRVFPRQKTTQNPPKLDFLKFESFENYTDFGKEILDSIAQVGCLELINHGISQDLIEEVLEQGKRIFDISPEKKKAVARSPERPYGFEEIHGDLDEIRDESEEFLWCGEEEMMRLEMEGIWPNGYSNFSKKMEKLSGHMEEIAAKLLIFLQQNKFGKFSVGNGTKIDQELGGNYCFIHKHCRKTDGEQSDNSLRYDVIRMLVRGSEFSHALCLNVCSGSTDFHVYSKKGWLSFCPNQDSIVVTIGDKLQIWSGGQYKHVIGRPIFSNKNETCISMGFLYSPQSMEGSMIDDRIGTISIGQQIIFAILLTVVYQILAHVYSFF